MYYDGRLSVVYLITSNKYFKNLHCVLIFNLSVSTYPSCSNSPPLPNSTNQEISMFYRDCLFVMAIFYYGCFAQSGGANDFNRSSCLRVSSRVHATQVETVSTLFACTSDESFFDF